MSQSTSLTETPSANEQHIPLLLKRWSNQYFDGSLAWRPSSRAKTGLPNATSKTGLPNATSKATAKAYLRMSAALNGAILMHSRTPEARDQIREAQRLFTASAEASNDGLDRT